jgi:ABC-2 type transport system permease protein
VSTPLPELAASWATTRRGPAHWVASWRSMLRWELSGLRLMLPVMILVQLLMGAGFAIGFGLIVPELSEEAATYLVSGAAAMTLIIVGLSVGPQIVSSHRRAGTYEFLWGLPVPRSAATAAWFVVTLLLGLPAFVTTLLVGSWRYDLSLSIEPVALVAAVLLVVFSATLLGYALAHAVKSPMLVMVLSQVLIFVVIGFSPINYPAERLPGWLQQVHDWLPLESMGQVVRAALTDGIVDAVARPYVLLTVWAAVAVAITGLTLRRRG